MDNQGKFIVFEGLTCSGKSLQAEILFNHFSDNNLPVFLNCEPTNDRCFGQFIRCIIEGKTINKKLRQRMEASFTILTCHPEFDFDADLLKLVKEIYYKFLDGQVITEFERQVIFIADRWEDLVCHVIFRINFIKVKDRYDLSTFAFGMAHGIDYEKLARLHKKWLSGVYRRPDVTYFIDVNPEEAIRRLEKSGKVVDRYESLESAKKVKSAYEELFTLRKEFLGDLIIIDGDQNIEQVTHDIITRL